MSPQLFRQLYRRIYTVCSRIQTNLTKKVSYLLDIREEYSSLREAARDPGWNQTLSLRAWGGFRKAKSKSKS